MLSATAHDKVGDPLASAERNWALAQGKPFLISAESTMKSRKVLSMKTIRKIIKEVVNLELENRGLLTGDLSEVLSDKIWSPFKKERCAREMRVRIEWINALMRLCRANSYTASSALRLQISECGKALIQSGAEINDLEEFSKWWKIDTWRGQEYSCANSDTD